MSFSLFFRSFFFILSFFLTDVTTFFGTVANVLVCDFVVNEFEFRSLYYNYFMTNTLGKGMELFTLSPQLLLNNTTTVLQ